MNTRIRTELKLLLSACLLSAGACTKAPTFDLPTAVSPPSQPPADAVLRAGFGRADITPPSGLGLMGYGPEGLRAIGYRQRLYARALVLEDAAGERLGFVALDLGQVSILLQRRIAAEVMEPTGLGADRLILAATHTHAGPGHFFEVSAYNEYGSSVSGYDPEVVDFLVSRISAAIVEAADGLRPARIAWGSKDLWGVTRNRSPEAFARNEPEWKEKFAPPPGVSPDSGGVDPTLTMLRVDVLEPGGTPAAGPYRPAGALSVFAIHGTANPAGNRLYDADIQAPVQRRLEAHIDSINGAAGLFAPEAVHLVANGNEGDNSPNLSDSTRTELPRLVRSTRPGGPRSPPGYEEWRQASDARQAKHIRQAREGIASLAPHISEHAVELFDELGSATSADLRISRVFVAADMTASSTLRVCDPRNGTSSVAGAEDGPTRYRDWRLLGIINVGFEEGGSAINPESSGCQGAKEPFLGPLYEVVADEQALPTTVQLTVARVGPVVVGVVPFEATAVTGGKLREAIKAGVGIQAPPPDTVVLIGLANGYNSYVASEAEYGLQHYEGGSTLYGPKAAPICSPRRGWRSTGVMPNSSRISTACNTCRRRAMTLKARSHCRRLSCASVKGEDRTGSAGCLPAIRPRRSA